MALPEKKRGWRNISVDGNNYRWAAKHYGYPPFIFVEVLLADINGQRLRGTFDEDRMITPKVVEYMIVSAIESGWIPEIVNHKPFEIEGDALVKGTEFELNHPPNSKGPCG